MAGVCVVLIVPISPGPRFTAGGHNVLPTPAQAPRADKGLISHLLPLRDSGLTPCCKDLRSHQMKLSAVLCY